MRSIKLIIGVSVLLILCFASPTEAVEFTDSQITFELFDNLKNNDSRAPPIYGEVIQGEVDLHTYYVQYGHSTLEVSLTWNRNTNNDISLSCYPPDGSIYVWNDNIDGRFDGKISIKTNIPSSMTGSNWIFTVTGVSVSGTQSYILKINSY